MTPLLAWRQILDTGQSLCLGGYQVGVQSLDPHPPGHLGKSNPKLPLARRDRGRVTTGLQENPGQPRSMTPPALGSQSLPSLSQDRGPLQPLGVSSGTLPRHQG